jgi:hypothetical protein
MTDSTTTPQPVLQFDRAVSAGTGPVSGVTCSQCSTPITDSYFTLAAKPVCESCKRGFEDAVARTQAPRVFAKAIAFGLGAAIAGALVYYAVIALFDLEIGIVAILIGYMVGYAIRKAARGGGGRRYQILAAALTYFAVGLAYLPVVLNGSAHPAKTAADSAQTAKAFAVTTAVTGAQADTPTTSAPSSTSAVRAIALVIFYVFALPVIIVFGSMPSGVISAAIIAFGMQKAWSMTAGPKVSFAGPLRVAPVGPPVPDVSSAAQE